MRSLALTPPLLWIHVGSSVAKMKRLNKGFEPQLKRNTSYQLIIMDMDKKIQIAQLRAELSILEEGKETYIVVGDADYNILLCKGARVVDLKNTPSGHLAMKVDDYVNASVQKSETTYTLHASAG